MLQPDVNRDDEVVEVFTGDSLEQAMAYAVAALGPDLQVRRARKVRKGVAGLAGRDKYEVVAVPGTEPVATDAVESAFDALLNEAEQAEDPRPVRRTIRLTPHPAPTVADHDEIVTLVRARQPLEALEPEPVVAVPEPAPEPEPEPEPVLVALPAPAPAPAPVKKAATRTAKTGTKAPVVAEAGPSGWSRAALVALGVPPHVLAGLPEQDPTDDLAWAAALAAAIAVVLPSPAALSETDPVVVDGHGVDGALGILRAAQLGMTPGTITAGGRTAPASAAELALVLRAAVVR